MKGGTARTNPIWVSGQLEAFKEWISITILGALFRWPVEQRYVLANPFAGIKVRGSSPTALDASRAFTDGEWALVRTPCVREYAAFAPRCNAVFRLPCDPHDRSYRFDVRSLLALRPHLDVEDHLLVFLQGFETFSLRYEACPRTIGELLAKTTVPCPGVGEPCTAFQMLDVDCTG